MIDLDNEIREVEASVRQLNANDEGMRKNLTELQELKYSLDETNEVMKGTTGIVGSLSQVVEADDAGSPLLGSHRGGAGASNAYETEERSSSTRTLTGVVAHSQVLAFERVLWRALRGNLYLRFTPINDEIKDPVTEEVVPRDVFMIVIHGEQTAKRVNKICDSFRAHLYPIPETVEARAALMSQVEVRLNDIRSVLQRTNEHRLRVLTQLADKFTSWSDAVTKEKATYATLNLLSRDMSSKCLVAEGWVPTSAIAEVQQALRRGTEAAKTLVPTVMHVMTTTETPPTHFYTNKFTAGFHMIVQAYGVARYRELNPTPFSIITFPFLFAVMFGDFGHALIMSLFAIVVCWKEKELISWAKGEMTGVIYEGRYIILLMGLFSIYTGLMYNDIFSKTMGIFKTGWDFEHINGTNIEQGVWQNSIYAFGIDVGWHAADNLLIFTNSYKMKMSIIFGVVQMTFGIILSLFNHLHFRKYVSAVNEFIPQVLFLHSIFGYLCVCVIYKWCVDWNNRPPGSTPVPSLLNMLIYMFLSPTRVIEDPLYEGQSTLQQILLIVALLCVPWMLLVKPFWLRYKHNKQAAAGAHGYHVVASTEEGHAHAAEAHDDDEEAHGGSSASAAAVKKTDAHTSGGDHGHDGEEFDFGEIFIHQVIHTIEFCLGAISNTASYLRLWALSLAHAQLSDVLWSMTVGNFITAPYSFTVIIGLWATAAMWFTLTVGILICMEGLSAFLHALRLHWVEFNNKFYEGSGYLFRPFSYERLLSGDDEE